MDKLQTSLKNIETIYSKTSRQAQSQVIGKLSKKTAEGGSFHDGLRNGLDSAINLLKDVKDLNTVAEITSYLEEVRDSIRPGMAYENAPLSAKELQELMSFDI